MTYSDRFINLAKEEKISEATIAKMAEFKGRLEAHNIIKTADGYTGPRMSMSKLLLLAAALGTAPHVIGGAVSYAQKILLDRKKGPSFEKMLEYHPALKKEDQETIARYFDSMWHFSPHNSSLLVSIS